MACSCWGKQGWRQAGVNARDFEIFFIVGVCTICTNSKKIWITYTDVSLVLAPTSPALRHELRLDMLLGLPGLVAPTISLGHWSPLKTPPFLPWLALTGESALKASWKEYVLNELASPISKWVMLFHWFIFSMVLYWLFLVSVFVIYGYGMNFCLQNLLFLGLTFSWNK